MSLLKVLQLLCRINIDSVVDPKTGKVYYFDPLREDIVDVDYLTLK